MSARPRIARALAAASALAPACALVVGCTLAHPAPAAATHLEAPTAADYRARVESARDAADAALADGAVTAQEAEDVVIQVDTFVPARETVTLAGEQVAVDNSTLRSLTVTLLSAETGPNRLVALEDVRDQLVTIEHAARELSTQLAEDPAALERALARVRPQDAIDLAALLQRVVEWLADRLGFGEAPAASPAASTAWRIVTWGAVLALVALLALAVARTLARWRRAIARRERVTGAEGAGVGDGVGLDAAEGLPADALAHADALAAAGERRAALRALFGAAARSACDAGWLRQTRTRTNAELLAELHASAPATHPDMRALSSAFEVAWYGHADPGPNGYSDARVRYLAVAGAADAALAAEGGEAA